MKHRPADTPFHRPAPALPGAPAGPDSGSGDAVPLTDRLAALAEPVHLRILRLLEQEELSVGEVAQVVQAPQSTVSRRLKVLCDAGWLFKRAEGTATFYRLLMDDLPGEARSLWAAVRAQLAGAHTSGGASLAAQLRSDSQRLEAVLAQRASDSLAYFGRIAGEWDAIRSEFFGEGFTTGALLALLPAEWSVADLGCGTGNAAEHLAPHVARVIAVDQSAPMLKAARKRLHAFENVEFIRAELTALPLADSSVDAATCVLVLHHIERPVDVLREVARILTPRGIALIIDMQAHDRRIFRTTLGHKHLGFTDTAMRAMLEEAGLRAARIVPLPGAPEGKGPGLFVATARKPDADRSAPFDVDPD